MTESSHPGPPDTRHTGPVAAVPVVDEEVPGEGAGRSRRPRRHRQWRAGGSSTRRWGWELFGWAVIALGAGVLASSALNLLVGGQLGAVLASLALWAAIAAAVVLAFARSRPRGLLGLRPVDLLYGIVLGGMLRIVQGWLEIAGGGSGAWPAYPSLTGQLPPTWLFDELLTGVVVAPVLEEFFFRGVVLVAVYTAVRRKFGRGAAVLASAVISTVLFVLAHAVFGAMTWDAAVTLTLVGLTASLLVLWTGRIWGAVLVHVVYNGLFVALATVGTLLSA